jgi:hypothetical protein
VDGKKAIQPVYFQHLEIEIGKGKGKNLPEFMNLIKKSSIKKVEREKKPERLFAGKSPTLRPAKTALVLYFLL